MRLVLPLMALAAAPCLASGPAEAAPTTTNSVRATARIQVRSALDKLRLASTVRVHYRAAQVRPAMVRGITLALPGATLDARARSFLSSYPGLVVARSKDLVLRDTRHGPGVRILRFEQRHRGIPVEGALVTMSFDRLGRLTAVHSSTRVFQLASTRSRINTHRAARAAFDHVAKRRAPTRRETQLLSKVTGTLVVRAQGANARLVYRVALPLSMDLAGRLHYIDAKTGRYVGWRPGVVWHRRRHTTRKGGAR